MVETPLVSEGAIERGKKIGLTGATGFAKGCHLHFEVRHFAGIRGLYNEDWRNIYGKGDKRHDPAFLAGWSDPETWISSLKPYASSDSLGGNISSNTIYEPPIKGSDIVSQGGIGNIALMDIQRNPEILQQKLNEFGYNAGPVDGYLGPQTRTALMRFQAERCLLPTGQMNNQTANALMSTDGFATPCTDAYLPSGISANTPLLSGTYVDAPAKCQLDHLSDVENATSLWIIRGVEHQIFGYDSRCTVRRTDISNGLTKFSADCTNEGSARGPYQWLADLQANDRFTTWSGDPVGPGQTFTRCKDDTPLAIANTYEAAVEGLTIENSGPDLFNIFLDLVGEHCAQTACLYFDRAERKCESPCEIKGVSGTYSVEMISSPDVSRLFSRISDQIAFYVQQGIPRGVDEDLDPNNIEEMEAYRVFRKGCKAEDCESFVVLVRDEFQGHVLDIRASITKPKSERNDTETEQPIVPKPKAPDTILITNLADYLENGGNDALSALSRGVRLAFTPSQTSFMSGKILMHNSSVPTSAKEAVGNLNKSFSWQGWMDVTQGNNPTSRSIRVTCEFDPNDPGLEQEAFSVVSAKLLQYNDQSAIFACSTM
jgi:peptidoglycan hydrolase-like protein with peptidoglycan-binding domain